MTIELRTQSRAIFTFGRPTVAIRERIRGYASGLKLRINQEITETRRHYESAKSQMMGILGKTSRDVIGLSHRKHFVHCLCVVFISGAAFTANNFPKIIPVDGATGYFAHRHRRQGVEEVNLAAPSRRPVGHGADQAAWAEFLSTFFFTAFVGLVLCAKVTEEG